MTTAAAQQAASVPRRRRRGERTRPLPLTKSRWWASSAGGGSALRDLQPLLLALVVAAMVAYQVVPAAQLHVTQVANADSAVLLLATVLSVAAPVVQRGWAVRRLLAGLVVAMTVLLVAVAVVGRAPHGWGGVVSVLTTAIVVSAVAVGAAEVVQRRAERGAPRLAIRSPFVEGRHGVVHGGARFTNQHAVVRSQRLALDIVRVRAVGPATRRMVPRRMGDHLGFGSPLVSPVDGTVVTAMDGVDDATGLRWPRGGNIVVIEPDGLAGWRILMAHLRYATVAVVPGQRVRRGQVVGQMGSSGNSTEPHLHLQANDAAGRPVVLLIDDRRRGLRRNDVVVGRLVDGADGPAVHGAPPVAAPPGVEVAAARR